MEQGDVEGLRVLKDVGEFRIRRAALTVATGYSKGDSRFLCRAAHSRRRRSWSGSSRRAYKSRLAVWIGWGGARDWCGPPPHPVRSDGRRCNAVERGARCRRDGAV